MALAKGRYLLLLNADAMVTPGSVQAMLDRLRIDPHAGIVGPRLVYGDGSWQRWTAGSDPQLLDCLTAHAQLEAENAELRNTVPAAPAIASFSSDTATVRRRLHQRNSARAHRHGRG